MDELQFRLKELELRAEIAKINADAEKEAKIEIAKINANAEKEAKIEIAKINAEKEIEIKKLEGSTIFYYLYSSY